MGVSLRQFLISPHSILCLPEPPAVSLPFLSRLQNPQPNPLTQIFSPIFSPIFSHPKLPSPKHVAIQILGCTVNASQILKSTDYSRHSKYHHPISFSSTVPVFLIRLHLVDTMSETCLFCHGQVAIPHRRWWSGWAVALPQSNATSATNTAIDSRINTMPGQLIDTATLLPIKSRSWL